MSEPRLILNIGEKYYKVAKIPFEDNHIGWTLTPFGGADRKTYSIISGAGSCTCECGDFSFVKQMKGEFCKHLTAAIQIGLLP